jgi:hypothetical protein
MRKYIKFYLPAEIKFDKYKRAQKLLDTLIKTQCLFVLLILNQFTKYYI